MKARSDTGFALPVTIFAMMVIGVMVTAAFFTSRQEARIGVAGESAVRAFYDTERAINEFLAGWSQRNYAWMDDWEDTTVSGSLDNVDYSVRVTRLADKMYFIDAQGTLAQGNLLAGAGRRIGIILRLRTADMDPPAALTAQGPIQIGGSSQINGSDTVPSGWNTTVCDTASFEDMPGIVSDDTTQLTYSGTKYEITGDPAKVQDTTMSDTLFTDFGDLTWTDLVAAAEKTYSSGTTITSIAPDSVLSGGSYQCRTTTLSNWGNPLSSTSVCFSYFPIIYGSGDLKISSSSKGQGILLVQGDLEVTGGFNFYGIAIVRGRLKTTGTGGHFYGAVMAENVDLETSQVLGNAVIQYSSCAVETAVTNSSITRARPLTQRSWVDLSALVY